MIFRELCKTTAALRCPLQAREILRTFPAGVPTYTPGDKRLEEFIGERHDESQEFVVERIVGELVWPRDVSGFEVRVARQPQCQRQGALMERDTQVAGSH